MKNDNLSRRNFLKLAGASIAFGTLGSSLPTFLKNKEVINGLDKFDYVVVLMLENRSFDNMLGYLYTPENPPPNGQSFEGVAYHDLSNPIPSYADSSFVNNVPIHKDSVMDNPNPDPGEEYPHISTQLFGTVIPDTNRFLDYTEMFPPYNLPDPLPTNFPMNGFVQDYVNNFRATQGRMPTYSEYKIIMSCFPPDIVPVISTIAKGFAVCDHWFCSVPSQTFCNRSFFNSGSSWGYVNNEPYTKWLFNFQETIFQRLQSQGHSWRIYFDHEDVLPLTLLIHFPGLVKYAATNICNFDNFEYDVANGKLPNYTFIEPRLIFDENDEHPPSFVIGNVTLPSNVLEGEKLINKVYNAIRQSNSKTGNNSENTLLIITYDEHGGCYDHVQPPGAVPPYLLQPDPEMGFAFDRLGIRVSAVLVSAYINSGTVINENLTHTSVIKTMSDKWNLGHLTNRDLTSPNLSSVFNLSTPRASDTWPIPVARQDLIEGDKSYFLNKKLTSMQRGIIGLANAIAYNSNKIPDGIKTVEDGLLFLESVKKKMGISFCS